MRYRQARQASTDYWPGFVDALATLLLVIIFLLSIFMLAQFFLNQALTGRDERLAQLSTELAALSSELDLEQASNEELQDEVRRLRATLATAESTLASAEDEEARLRSLLAASGEEAEGLRTALTEQEARTAEAAEDVRLLNEQLAALRVQLASLQEALDIAEAKDADQEAQIANLGTRLNAALAQKVGELAAYRSEFFGRLKDALGNRDDIEIVGDRFVLQSEIFFESGSADISPAGQGELQKLATLVIGIADQIPDDLPWIIRVDGHSDRQPIATPEFPSNWHLSAARAVAVVRFLESRGVPARRLAAAGFGEYHPLDPSRSGEAYKRNRRIELKLTER
ncbi:MAG: peptidoglycan -binding protein [Alphaproteobacteria bacterium]|nr:peptidoglycan -binding protein [Alphaproteobacteria bacterium]